MPRSLRPQVENGIYHVTARGNRRQDVYHDPADRRYFLNVLTGVVERYGWLIHTYCLMTNHYHLLVETPQPNISAGMQRLNAIHAEWINWRYGYVGHLFQGRFHSVLVESNWHLIELSRYIVLNPVRAGICEDPGEWRWSSYRAMLNLDPAPPFLTVEMILHQFADDLETARKRYEAFVAAGVEEALLARNGHVPGLTQDVAV